MEDRPRLHLETFSSLAAGLLLVALLPATSSAGEGANLLGNGSFERWAPGRRAMPDEWFFRPWAREDVATLVTDASRAHSGLRYVRMSSPKGRMKFDALPGGRGLVLEPGKTYDIRLWARTDPGVETATLLVEPGHHRAGITPEWKEYAFTWTHPADAKPLLGLTIACEGGPIAVDDVSMTPAGVAPVWRASVTADRKGLKQLPVHLDWRDRQGGRPWPLRIPIRISEVVGEPAKRHLVTLHVSDLLDAYSYAGLSPSNVLLVDASADPAKRVPSQLVDSHPRIQGISPKDTFSFLANVPPRSTKTYFLYLDPTTPVSPPAALPKELGRRFARPSEYAHELDIEIGRPEEPLRIDAKMANGAPRVSVRAYGAANVIATLTDPEGDKEIDLALARSDEAPFLWQTKDNAALPDDAPSGIWQVNVVATDALGNEIAKSAPLVNGLAMWWSPLVEKVLPSATPQYGRDWARPCAARNEREAFLVMLETDRDLKGVSLAISDLVRRDRKARIDASNVALDLAEAVRCPSVPQGPYPDALLPWRARDIAAGERRTALVTIRVPKNAAPGEYWGTLTATAKDGTESELAVTLDIFDFALPDRLTFQPLWWADNFQGAPRKGDVVKGDRRALYDRNDPSGAVLELARIVADCNGSSFYSHHDKAPYAVPWHWDPQTKTATFDFTFLDKNAKIMLDDFGQQYLCFGGKFRPAGRRTGRAWDWDRDLDKAMTYDGEMALPAHKAALDTDEGKAMYRAYCQGIAEHLKDKGWLDRTYIYVCDETDRGAPSESAKWCAQAAHEAGFKTFAASLAWEWPAYMSEIDAFAGLVSPESRKRIREEEHAWWGRYNRPCYIHYPLANARLLPTDSFFGGTDRYITYFFDYSNIWIDISEPYPVPPNAAYGWRDFIKGAYADRSYSTWVYPYPSWEPDEGAASPGPFAPSLRLAALREGVEDYEYLRLLAEVDKTQKNDPHGGRPARDLADEVRALLQESVRNDRLMHAQDVFYVTDAERFYDLRRRIGRMIAGGLPADR